MLVLSVIEGLSFITLCPSEVFREFLLSLRIEQSECSNSLLILFVMNVRPVMTVSFPEGLGLLFEQAGISVVVR